jgi:hypothetical protein
VSWTVLSYAFVLGMVARWAAISVRSRLVGSLPRWTRWPGMVDRLERREPGQAEVGTRRC